MAQEWILANTGESFDKWQEQNFDGQIVTWRKYIFTCERYAKYIPPLTLPLTADIGDVLSPSQVEVNACGQQVTLLDLMTYEIDEGYPDVELVSRTLQYSVGESGVLVISESYQTTEFEEEWWDPGSAEGDAEFRSPGWRKKSEYTEI